jgi:hypothetical protein
LATNAGADCKGLRAQLVKALNLLAASSPTQIAYIKEGSLHHDELALEFDDVAGAFTSNCEATKVQQLTLRALDQQLDRISGPDHSTLWTDRGLTNSVEWSVVRGLAGHCLFQLGEQPPDLSDPTSAIPSIALTDPATPIYRLVLRHTVEVGNGWGSSPSPLRGFFVLDRAVAGIEDPSFNPAALDDRGLGLRFSDELMEDLKASLEGTTPVEFVPGWMSLIDLEAQRPVLVKDSKGIIALGSPMVAGQTAVMGVYFYAGGRWSRTNRYELAESDGQWAIRDFRSVVVS